MIGASARISTEGPVYPQLRVAFPQDGGFHFDPQKGNARAFSYNRTHDQGHEAGLFAEIC